MNTDRPHRRLRAWELAIELAETVYRLTSSFPPEERFGLSAQMRRAAVSVSSNVAEGAARGSSKEYVWFLYVARGSLSELDTQVELAVRLDYTDGSRLRRVDAISRELSAVLNGLIQKVRAQSRAVTGGP